jgi:outer membrane immunogenic protein
MVRIINVIITVVILLTGAVFAAEPLHDKPTNQPSWTGIYVGGHLGYGWDRAIWTSVSAPSPVVDYVQGARITSHQVSGVFGGGHLGFNYQLGPLVFGIEPSYSAGHFHDGSRSNTGSGDDEYTTKINHLFSTTLRTGYATKRWLTYFKIGYASGSVKTRLADNVGIEQGEGSSSERHHGFVMGPGIEFRVTPNIILGTEYNYLGLGSAKHSVGGLGSGLGPVVNKVDLQGMHQLTVRLSYLFGW